MKTDLKWYKAIYETVSHSFLSSKSLSCVGLVVTPRIIQSMEFSRPEYWSGQPFPTPGNLPNPGTKRRSPAQSCPTLCDPMDCSLPGSSVHRVLQARILEWEPFPSPEILPKPGIEPASPAVQVDSLPSEPAGKPISHLNSSAEIWLCLNWRCYPRSHYQFNSLQFNSSVVSYSLRPHESQRARPPCPSQSPSIHSNSHPLSPWCHPAISSSVVPSSSCPNPSQHQSLFQWVNSSHEVAKVLELQF